MSATHSTEPGWYNGNELRAYPIADDAPAGASIPTQCIVDMSITADRSFDSVFVSSFYLSSAIVSICVSGSMGGRTYGLLTCTRTRDEIAPYRTVAMDPIGDAARGVVVFGDMFLPDVPRCRETPIKLSFGPAEGAISPRAVTKIDTGWISAICDKDGNSASGVVRLGGNVAFTSRLAFDADGSQYVDLHLNDGYGDMVLSPCNGVPSYSTCGMTPVKTINGVRPDAGGKITIRFV